MLILCPSCASSYNISAAKLGAGRTVRCKKCQACWYATPPETDPFADAVAPILAAADGFEALASKPDAPDSTLARDATDAFAADPAPEPVEAAARPADATPADAFAFQALPEPLPEGPAPLPYKDAAPALEIAPVAGPAPTHRPSLAGRLAAPAMRLRGLFKRPAATGAPRRSPLVAALPYAALGLSCAGVVALAAQGPISAAAPGARKVYAALGLGPSAPISITSLTSEIVPGDGGDVLMVQGELINHAGKLAPIPPLRVVIRDEQGVELYAWPAQSLKLALEPGERTVFRARLASPPAAGKAVQVRFESGEGDAHPPRSS